MRFFLVLVLSAFCLSAAAGCATQVEIDAEDRRGGGE